MSTQASPTPLVTAVIPCLNEELTLALCIRKAQAAFEKLGIVGEIIVADNGSTDKSVQIAQDLGAVVVHQTVRGYGAALDAGINAARGRIVIMGDADDSYDWSAIGPFISKIEEGYDLVMGNRFTGGIEPGAMPPLHKYLGNPVLSFISRIAFRIPIGDFHCGMRAFTKAAYQRLNLRTTGMEYATEMIAAAARIKLRVTEIPFQLHKDKRDRPPHLRSFRDGWRHLRFIVMSAPDHLYLWPGVSALIIGLVLQAALFRAPISLFGIYFGIHFLALAGLLTLAGFNTVSMGVLAKLILQSQYPGTVSPFLDKFTHRFNLEHALISGGVVFGIGFLADCGFLFHWLTQYGASMSGSVHPALVCTNLIVLGISIVFNAFLVQLVLKR
ncbi:glycosyltransferase family 2 protein [Silvimonas iriomotensis]|uniref:Dolichol-P-glucose synthetase n=1 Tax=Silvimonas iriomotensis TaxID=449662 RepID=A0ABQ2PDV8_9NEIS|nr:glycosyltransferase family 2 protein [Silvimonas iriomotensis]GGP23734.1 dolichol-P-glucose synthetase [Silvimonas iriomotensis]